MSKKGARFERRLAERRRQRESVAAIEDGRQKAKERAEEDDSYDPIQEMLDSRKR